VQKIKETVLEVISAITPVTVIVLILQFAIIRLPLNMLLQFLAGVVLVGVGLTLFLLGAYLGILPMGEHIGATLAKTGKPWFVVLSGLLLGFFVTIAEPNVRVLAIQIDLVSGGAIPKSLLIYAIATGIGISIGLAMLRIILDIPIRYLLVAGYGIAFLLTLFAPPQFLPIAFDSGGVSTGPMVVPFNLALGIGVASVLGGRSPSSESFGLVALAYIGPVLAVLLLGVIYG
jgi:hypothetical protein